MRRENTAWWKPDFAVIAAIENGRMYLVEQYRYPVGGRYWEMPQGSWEQQTIDPLELARRSCAKRPGWSPGRCATSAGSSWPTAIPRQAYDVFLASALEQLETQLDPEEEGLVAKAFDVAVVEQMIFDGVIQDASTVAAFGLLRLKKLILRGASAAPVLHLRARLRPDQDVPRAGLVVRRPASQC